MVRSGREEGEEGRGGEERVREEKRRKKRRRRRRGGEGKRRRGGGGGEGGGEERVREEEAEEEKAKAAAGPAQCRPEELPEPRGGAVAAAAPQMSLVPLLLLLLLLLAPGSAEVAPGVTGECQPRGRGWPGRVRAVPGAPPPVLGRFGRTGPNWAELGRGGKGGRDPPPHGAAPGFGKLFLAPDLRGEGDSRLGHALIPEKSF